MEITLCPHKYIFGKEKTGIHSYRIFNIAIIDLSLTIILSWIITKYFNLDFKQTSIALLLIGIISHRIFCIETTIDKLLFSR
jgi:hypothetical protein